MPRAGTSELKRTVGTNVARLRRGRRLSAGELARRAGIGKATLSRIEAGTHNPTIETLHALTSALDVPLGTPLHDTPVPQLHGASIQAELVAHLEDPDGTTELYRVTIFPHHPPHPAASAPGLTKTVVVFGGTLVVAGADHTRRLGCGDSASWEAGTAEAYSAGDDQTVTAAILLRHPAPR